MSLKTAVRHNIMVVDNQPVVREGLARIIGQQKDLTICGEANDTNEALAHMQTRNPDLVIADFPADGATGVDFPKNFRHQFPNIPLLIFTTHQESFYAERFLRAGVNGYVMKHESGNTVLTAIRQVLEKKTYVSPQLNERILQKLSGSDQETDAPIKERLSARELKVFELIGHGYNTRKISEELSMAMKTVETHRLHIKTKLQIG